MAHAPIVDNVTDARVAYDAEYNRLDTANDRLNATRKCQASQRNKFATAKAK